MESLRFARTSSYFSTLIHSSSVRELNDIPVEAYFRFLQYAKRPTKSLSTHKHVKLERKFGSAQLI